MGTPLVPTEPAPVPDRAVDARRGRVAVVLTGFGTEVHKNLLSYGAGWGANVAQLVMFPTFSLLIALFIGRGQLRDELLVLTVIGFVPYVLAYEQLNRMFWTYVGDSQQGVLEATFLTPVPSWVLAAGRQLVAIIAGLPLAAAVYVACFVALALRGGTMPFDPQVLLPLAAIVVGSAGVALALSGLTLVVKRLEILPTLVISVWFFAGGAFVPLDAMPAWAAVPSRLLIPFSPGIEAIHDILLDQRSLATLQNGWGLGWLLVQPILLLVAGALLFTYLQRVALRRGTLGSY